MARTQKDFSKINTGKLTESIDRATSNRQQQAPAPPAERIARAEDMRTQGRKGCKAVRINCAFSTSNHQFIKIMSKASGRTMTQMVNDIIAAYRNEHPEFLEQAQNFLKWINGGAFSKLPEEPIEEEYNQITEEDPAEE